MIELDRSDRVDRVAMPDDSLDDEERSPWWSIDLFALDALLIALVLVVGVLLGLLI